jgi:general secretion pathway protein B
MQETVKTVVIAEPEKSTAAQAPGIAPSADLPLYTELSRGLRERMPQLEMSLHFYTDEPQRRLTRINNRILREGDWVNQDVQLVEITPTGAVLDYLGTKTFIMQCASR